MDGGKGIGRVTRPGLSCPVGSAAINPVPRAMIEEAVAGVCRECREPCGIKVIISIPDGERLAKKTYNPRLGIEGGLSVLGTSGIVEPMSEKALLHSIELELKMAASAGRRYVLISPGNYGEDFSRKTLGLNTEYSVKCSNYIGETVDFAAQFGFRGLLLVGHAGKLVKLAAGVMNTHSRVADCRMETLAAHAALFGADRQIVRSILDCITTDEAFGVLERAGPVSYTHLEQTRQSLKNIQNILKEAGLDMSDIVKTTVLLKNMGDFADMNGVYAEFFTEAFPARAAFEVSALPKDALVEIEAVAAAK